MFESITDSLSQVMRKLSGAKRLTEKNIDEGLREVRTALLAADVNVRVVKGFIKKVRDRAVGQEVIRAVEPGQQIVKIVHDELVALMGESDTSIRRSDKPDQPTVIMLCGLQGSGKTTTCGKLARYLKGKGHRPLLVAADVQRPAAIEQLKQLGQTLEVPVYSEKPGWLRGKPTGICQRAFKQATTEQNDFLILDTAGRLHIDRELMAELGDIHKKVKPQNVFLVSDAMTGQDAVNSAEAFDRELPLDGLILTKLDGDARGGAALSIRAVTGKPVKFIGVGEKLDKLQPFHPERMASQILGMGDIVTLVERAQEVIDQDQAEDAAAKLLGGGSFTLDDFLNQISQVQKLGPIKDWLGMIPGLGQAMKDMPIDDRDLGAIKAMISSMTKEERRRPDVINQSRRRRIARGSGHSPADINALIKQFKQTQKIMKGIGKMPGLRSMFGRGRKELQEKIQAHSAAASRKRRRRKGF